MQELISYDPENRVDFLHSRILLCHYILLIALALSSCSAAPTPPAITSTPSQPTKTATAMATTTSQPPAETAQLIPAAAVHAYPGPEHYAGDMLTFEIPNDGNFGDETVIVSMSLDNIGPTEISANSSWSGLLLPLAFDTTNLTGRHTLKFTTADGRLNETYSFDVLPADQRPANEQNATWLVNETACCRLHYISKTAAARDIEFITDRFQQAAEDFATITGENIDPKLDVYIIDRIWGNGGFGGDGELVISYTDRYYGPTIGAEGLETLVRHEFTHAAGVGLEQVGDGIEFNYEGLAVYVAGGHYKPEPLAQRGAALYDLGHYVPVGQFLDQHELAYLYPAAMLTYIVEAYGSEKLWQFLAADENPEDKQPGSLEAALQATFGVSLKDFDQDFQAWLEGQEPEEQLEDLRLTIELQDLRRQYQDTYAPPPYFFLGKAEEALARPEYLPVALREAHAPPNIAIELIIANAQQVIVDGDYSNAKQLMAALKDVLTTQEFQDPLAKEYLDIAIVLTNAGYNPASLDLQDDMALVEVTRDNTELISLELKRNDGIWQILQ